METIQNFSGVFKKSFIEGFASSLSAVEIVTSLGVAFLLTIGIFLFYKLMTKNVMYSKSFNISMACIALVTAVVIMAVRSNVVLSLGMVGALSIVRFRTAIKDPMDLIFLFWSISIGIVTGAGNFFLAIIGSAVIAAAMLVYSFLPTAKNPYLLVANCVTSEAADFVVEYVKKNTKHYKIKSKSMSGEHIELTIQMSLINPADMFFGKELTEKDGVESAVILSYDGEYV